MLFGRERECLRVESLVAEALAGRSAALVVSGEAGIGKSALLDHAVERAAGLLALRARGYETESRLAFSALADLLRPVIDRVDVVPEAQAAALKGALAIGPPVEADRFAICAATLSLLAVVAEDAPVLCVIDDAQWVDASSLEAVIFSVRRLDAEGVAVLFGTREGESPLLERAGLPRLLLAGLEPAASAELLAAHTGDGVVADVARRLAEATAGNPLALIEIPTLLTQGQLSGAEPLPAQLPAAPTVEQAFLRRLSALPGESRVALAVAAAAETSDLDEIGVALTALGSRIEALDAAESAGLVSLAGDRVEFRHPLLRATAYRSAPTSARRAAHEALARAGADRGAPSRAWHLAAAASEQDGSAAAALEEAARETRARGGLSESSAAFERAAQLTADQAEQGRLLREAANDARLAGRIDRALELLDTALPLAAEPVERARLQHLRGVIEMWDGSPLRAYELLAEEANRVEPFDPDRAVRMLTDAVWAVSLAGRIETGVETGRRAVALAERCGSEAATVARAVLGVGLVLRGEVASALPLLADYHRRLSESVGLDGVYREVARPAGQVLMWFERYEEAHAVLSRAIDAARGRSALGTLPYALAELAQVDFRTGNWVAAYAGASEAVRLAEDTGQDGVLAYSLGCLAQIEAAQGREEDCRAHARRALELGYPHVAAAVAYATAALGQLELGLGRPDLAVSQLETLAERLGEYGLREPGVIQWTPDLVEGYARSGRRDQAERVLTIFESAAQGTGRTWALGACARCHGLLSEAEFERPLGEALELHRQTPTPFERARSELCLGERLRRARRRSESRAPLRAALETFELLGARPWAERARRELAATGETVRTQPARLADELTPTELQVALLVAGGATNKEAGAALFLSAKTVEAHLGRIYRKLGLRSRTELAARLASGGAVHETAATPADG